MHCVFPVRYDVIKMVGVGVGDDSGMLDREGRVGNWK